MLDLNAAAAVERSFVGAKAQRIEDLALWGATEDRVVDATDEVLDRHTGALGASRAHGRLGGERESSGGDREHDAKTEL